MQTILEEIKQTFNHFKEHNMNLLEINNHLWLETNNNSNRLVINNQLMDKQYKAKMICKTFNKIKITYIGFNNLIQQIIVKLVLFNKINFKDLICKDSNQDQGQDQELARIRRVSKIISILIK